MTAILTDRFCLIGGMFAAFFLGGCRQVPTATLSRVFSVCEVLRNADLYGGQVIRVRGIYFDALRGECPNAVMESGGSVWPSALNIVDSSLAASLRMPVVFETDRRSWEAVQAFWMKEAQKRIREEIWVTFEGQLQTADPGSKKLGGFGHLGVFPAQIVVKRVDLNSIKVESKPTYYYRVDEPRPQ